MIVASDHKLVVFDHTVHRPATDRWHRRDDVIIHCANESLFEIFRRDDREVLPMLKDRLAHVLSLPRHTSFGFHTALTQQKNMSQAAYLLAELERYERVDDAEEDYI